MSNLVSGLGGGTFLLVGIVLIGVPVFFVTLAASRRKQRVRSGEIVLVEKVNSLAVVAFVLSFFVAIAGIVLGHVALSQIHRTNERGWGLATAALVIGYVALAVSLIVLTALIVTAAARG